MLKPFDLVVFKKPIEAFECDMKSYCADFCASNRLFPDHLKNLEKLFRACAEADAAEPSDDYDKARAYIVDNRLRLLFAAEFDSFTVPDKVYKFIHDTKSFEDCAYGEGENLPDGFARCL